MFLHPLLEPSVVPPAGGSPFIVNRVGGVFTVRWVEGIDHLSVVGKVAM